MSELRFDKERLQQLMDEQKMGDTKLARKVGVSRQMIFHLRKGTRKTASAELMTRIAEALQTTVTYLLGEQNGDEVPRVIVRLAEVAASLSQTRQEELVRIADAFKQLEAEEDFLLVTREKMWELLRGFKDYSPGTEALLDAFRQEFGVSAGALALDAGHTSQQGEEDEAQAK